MNDSPDRRRPCVCKGWISPQDELDQASVQAAVADHNATETHVTWRHAAILAGDLAVPESAADTLRRNMGIPVAAVFRVERDRPGAEAEALPNGRAWYADPWTVDPDDEPETVARAMDGDR